MLLKENLTVNQKIEISIEDKPIRYKSIIQIVSKDKFAVGIPTHKGEPLILRAGDLVNIKLNSQNEHYIFTTTVLDRIKDQIPLYVLAYPDKAERVQLRDFVRVKIALEVLYQVVTEADITKQLFLNPTSKAITIDVSGGGVLFATEDVIPEAELLYLHIPIKIKNQEITIQTFGRVKRFIKASEPLNKNLVGIEYEGINERDRDAIIYFLFKRLRAQRLLER